MMTSFWLSFGTVALAAFFVLAGDFLVLAIPRPNAWAGVRTPWTYADQGIWREAHRFFGWGMVASGVLCLIYAPAGVIGVIIVGIGSLPFSWLRYRGKYGTGRTWHSEPGWEGYRPMAKCPPAAN